MLIKGLGLLEGWHIIVCETVLYVVVSHYVGQFSYYYFILVSCPFFIKSVSIIRDSTTTSTHLLSHTKSFRMLSNCLLSVQ